MAIYNDWVANFSTTAKCLLLSQGQIEAQDLLSKITFIHEHMPDYLKFPIDNANREFISFKGNHAQIRALASTEKAGHGFQASIVTRDEIARHEYARDNFRAVARSGGKLVELSTANKTCADDSQQGYFKEKTQAFLEDPATVKTVYESGLELYTNPNRPRVALVFLSWKLRPVREEGMTLDEWYKQQVEMEFTPVEREEQYPSTIEDVFRESGVRAYFEESALDDMSLQTDIPITQDELNTFNGVIRYYKPPIVGHRYIVYTDPSLGRVDPFVTRVKDRATGERVASACGVIKVDFSGQIHDYLVRTYSGGNEQKGAPNSFEYNGSAGGEFAGVLKDLGTPNIQVRRDHEGKILPDRKGLYMTGPLRKAMLERENYLIGKRQIINHDKEFISQARKVLRDNDLPLMNKHQSFDWVMADAGLEWIDKFSPVGEPKAFSMK